MKALTASQVTMTSLELVEFINKDRSARAKAAGAAFPSPGFAKLEHADFLKKVPEVLGHEHAGKFSCMFDVSIGNGATRKSPGYRFPKREACLMAMSYSYELQAKVFDRMTELEEAQAPDLSTDEGRLLMIQELSTKQLALVRENKVQAQQLALAAPKVNFFDKVAERTTLMTATQVAQKLGMSAIKLNKLLDELDVYSLNVKRARIFKQWVIDKGLGELKQTELGYSQPLFTTSGEAWIVERLTSEGVA